MSMQDREYFQEDQVRRDKLPHPVFHDDKPHQEPKWWRADTPSKPAYRQKKGINTKPNSNPIQRDISVSKIIMIWLVVGGIGYAISALFI